MLALKKRVILAGARWLIHNTNASVVTLEIPLLGDNELRKAEIQKHAEDHLERLHKIAAIDGSDTYIEKHFERKPLALSPQADDGYADVFGIDYKGNVRILEVKMSWGDYAKELETRKYEKALRYADYFYYLMPNLSWVERRDVVGSLPNGAGLLIYNDKIFKDFVGERYYACSNNNMNFGICAKKRPKRNNPEADRSDLWQRIAMTVFRRYYYGIGYSGPCYIESTWVEDKDKMAVGKVTKGDIKLWP